MGFWQGKKVLVTGHTGFKGSWLCLWLHQLGAQVSGFALEPPTRPSLYETAGVAECVDSHHGDITDLSALQSVFQRVRPEIVFHLAAQSLVLASYRQPVDTFRINVLGTANLLEATRRTDSIQALVNVTSDKCYDNRAQSLENPLFFREDANLGGQDPYSSSKACAELVTHAYRASYFGTEAGRACRIATARAGNVIGGGDWAEERLIPDIFRAIRANKDLTVRHPNAIRPWQHVLEPLHGYLLLAEKLWEGDASFEGGWNFGPDFRSPLTVRDLINEVLTRWFSEQSAFPAEIRTERNTPHAEAAILALDSRKSHHLLQWKSVLTMDMALDWLVEWHRAEAQGEPMQRLTLTQIGRYKAIVSQASAHREETA